MMCIAIKILCIAGIYLCSTIKFEARYILCWWTKSNKSKEGRNFVIRVSQRRTQTGTHACEFLKFLFVCGNTSKHPPWIPSCKWDGSNSLSLQTGDLFVFSFIRQRSLAFQILLGVSVQNLKSPCCKKTVSAAEIFPFNGFLKSALKW